MRIIERYLSAYVMDCLFGHVDDVHAEYTYQVLRETGSRINHPVLSKVLDFIRQGDPADPKVQAEVRAYVTALAVSYVAPKEQASEYECRFHVASGFMVILILRNGEKVGVGFAMESDKDLALKEVGERYPGIKIVQE